MSYEQIVQMVQNRLGPLWTNVGKKAYRAILHEELSHYGLTMEDAPTNPWRKVQGDHRNN